LKTICEPFLQQLPSVSKRSLVLNAILYKRLILCPTGGYFFFQTYPKLAEDSISICIDKEFKTVLEYINHRLNLGFEFAALRRKKPIDTWAANYALGGVTYGSLLAKALNVYNPVMIFKKLEEFYKEKRVKTFNFPFSQDEVGPYIKTIDEKAGRPALWFSESEYWKMMSDRDLSGAGHCTTDLIYSKLFSSHGYCYVPSHNWSILPSYVTTFHKIEKELRKCTRLSDAFKLFSTEESLKYLLGQRVGALHQLLGFTPLNPLWLIPSNMPNEQIDETLLKIRKDCSRVRELFEKVHTNSLKMELDKAVDAKTQLVGMKAN
jgi:hypothetical protein